MNRPAIALAAVALSACATPQPTQTTVAQVAAALTAADNLAIQYVTLPLCPRPGQLCSDKAVSANIKAAAARAYAAVKAAEASGSSGDLAAANAAVAALTALTPPAHAN